MSDFTDQQLMEIQELLDSLTNNPSPGPELKSRMRKLLSSDSTQTLSLLQLIQPFLKQLPPPAIELLGEQTQAVLRAVNHDVDEDALDFVEEALLRSTPDGRWHWLTVLALIQSAGSLDVFVREILETEATSQQQVLQAFAPLMQKLNYDPEWLFPALFDGLPQASLAPVIIDLANFCYRENLCDEHPAADRCGELLSLLDQLRKRLAEIESDPTSWASQPDQISKMISDSVAMIVSLCDAMALLEYQPAVEVLKLVAELRHRRVRAEAAYGLAKLGVEEGNSMLLELVDEPVSRLRIIQYADELGLGDQIDPSFRTDIARAESELALWLSQPNQMGVPPQEIELVDQRNCFWPSYDDPVNCFLFRFEYRLGENKLFNLALVGPMIHAFISDLQSLEINDVYSAFAGWQAEHEEIFELDLNSLSPHRQTDRFKLERRLHDSGAEQIETRILGLFFGEIFAVASCQFDGSPTWALVDADDVRFFPRNGSRPLDETVIYSIYVGHKLLSAFNP